MLSAPQAFVQFAKTLPNVTANNDDNLHQPREIVLTLFKPIIVKFIKRGSNVLPLLGSAQCNGINLAIISKE